MSSDDYLARIKPKSADIYRRAEEWCDDVVRRARRTIEEFAASRSQSLDDICFIVVGSVGRNEALDASDMDIVPVARNAEVLEAYKLHDQDVRQLLRTELDVDVSKGHELTKPDAIDSLIDPESVGGPKDSSESLTKRMLILTEGRQIAGSYPLEDICRNILDVYGSSERSSGRHTLSLCNDIARYYRTLCIEYKTKADVEGADWCTRNLKLRHSRKIWYFANMIAIAELAEFYPGGESEYNDKLLQRFLKPPIARLCETLQITQPVEVGLLLETYAFFLEFMSVKENREALSKIEHGSRYEIVLRNPFPMMKFNSDLLHHHMVRIIEGLPTSMRQHVFDWFLF